jgi:1-acyl-sn-glycerol-3-phosphate acyltransferase
VLYWLVKGVLTPILRTLYRPWVEGLENIPAEGGALIASNHLSYLDWIFLPLMVPRKISTTSPRRA